MKTLFTFIVFAVSINVSAQAPAIQWEQSYGGNDDEDTWSIQQTVDGGYIVAGTSASNNGEVTGHHGATGGSYHGDYWIVKLNSIGDLLWEKSLGGTGDDGASSIQQTKDGGFVVAGSSSSIDGDVTGNHGGYDCWIVKLDSAGIIQWEKSYGGSGEDYAYSLQQTTDGGYIIAGSSTSNNGDVTGHHGDTGVGAKADCWVVKINSSGIVQWEKSYGGSDADEASSIRQTKDSGYILAGNSTSNDGDVSGHHGDSTTNDYWIVKLDPAGNIQWEKSFGGSKSDIAASVQQTFDNGYIIAGFSYSIDGDVTGNHGEDDDWIVKLDSIGIIQWQNSFGGKNLDGAESIQQTRDSGYIVAGATSSKDGDVTGYHGGIEQDYWIIKLNSIGNIQWEKTLGGTFDDEARCSQQTSDGGYIVSGHSNSSNGDVTGVHGNSDFWIVKLGGYPAGIPAIENETNFSLFPNPANNTLTIKTPSLRPTNYFITDMIGRNILSGQLNHTTNTIDISQLAAGMYLLQMSPIPAFPMGEGGRQTFKIIKD